MIEKLDGLSMDLENANMEKLKAVFPECFSEGKLDIDKLLSLCGEYIDNDFEKYKFEWKGKAECLRLAQKRSIQLYRSSVILLTSLFLARTLTSPNTQFVSPQES